MLRRLLTVLATLVMVTPLLAVASTAPASAQSRFSDGDATIHTAAIEALAQVGVVGGYADGTYRPAETVRRDQMATFLAGVLRRAGVPLPAAGGSCFADVSAANPHRQAICGLARLGTVNGRSDAGRTVYDPAAPVTRASMATFLLNAHEAATGQRLRAVRSAFDDVGGVHADNISAAAQARLVRGTGWRTYTPGSPITRGQLASFVTAELDLLTDLGKVTPR
jgi:hypothetical protein